MTNIDKLHSKYLKQKAACSQNDLKLQQKTQEIHQVKKEISVLNERVIEVNRLLTNARIGIGQILSTEEFALLKKELDEKKKTLIDLNDSFNVQNNTLTSMSNDRRDIYSLKIARQEITAAISDKALIEIALAHPDKLKEFMHTTLAQQDIRLHNPDIYDAFYKQVGEKLCKQLFSTENGSLALPTIGEAMAERDALIESLA